MKKIIIPIIIAIIAIPIAVYAVSPVFTESSIDEALPENVMMLESDTEDIDDNIMMKYSGTFVGVNDGIHNAEGFAKVLPLDEGSQILRLENFKTTNGPDLYVYLSTDENASDFVNLGMLKANNGNQNYEIPDDVDLEKYDKVLIWCKSFSVLFGSAELN